MKKLFIFFVCFLLIPTLIFAFDDEDTHPRITKLALTNPNLDLVIKNNLGIPEGIKKSLKNMDTGETYSIFDWVWRGSRAEDTPPCRASNHFHNPLLPCSESYMSDDTTSLGLAIRIYCGTTGWPYADRKSAVTWAKGNGMGWSNARTYFYTALTSESNTDRETNFAKTFQALGQVIHLLQDMAVPSHVRNDFTSHLIFGGINSTNYKDVSKWYIQPFEFYIKNKPYLITSASSAASPSFLNAKLTNYWDTDQYTKNTNPSILTNPGLAEYTNSNFLSEETIFKGSLDSAHSFPYPAWSSVMEYDEVIDPVKGTVRTYLKKTKDGETINHLAAGKWFYKYLPSLLKNSGLKLDEQVYDDYAALLIPRAVGYSAGLLNYFFRGSIDMVRDTENDACQYVIYNLSNEYMEGDFGLYYDDASGNRNNVASGDLTANAGKPSNPITLDITEDLKNKSNYILVFKGTMGNETGAVVADAKVTPFTSSCGTELTISGADTTSKNSTELYTVDGCTGCSDDVTWEVSGAGAKIETSSDGIDLKNSIKVTTDDTACGTITITAGCPGCGINATKTVTISDTLEITETATPDCYAVKDGTGSYTWSISRGSIDENGCVNLTGQCGTATITVTDANGCTGTRDLQLPDSLTITGPDAGKCYTTTGTEPYIWYITKGSIDTKGCVDLTGQCGTATISVTDANKCIGEKELNLSAENCSSLTIVNENGTPATDTILRGGSKDYKTTGNCCENITWSVSATSGSSKGSAAIASNGVLTASGACGTLIVTATCAGCGTSDTQDVRVTDVGKWVLLSSCSAGHAACEECMGSTWMDYVIGKYKYHVLWLCSPYAVNYGCEVPPVTRPCPCPRASCPAWACRPDQCAAEIYNSNFLDKYEWKCL